MQEPQKLTLSSNIQGTALTPSRPKESILHRSKPTEIKNIPGNFYKIRSVPSFPDPRQLKKSHPKKISSDKERLYEENLAIKQLYNNVMEENLKLKTRIHQLEKHSDLRTLEVNGSNFKSSHLVENLKATVKELKVDLGRKEKEIEDIKKYIRYTKMQEMEADLSQYKSECERLRLIISEVFEDKGNTSGAERFEDMKKQLDQLTKELESKAQEGQALKDLVNEMKKQAGDKELDRNKIKSLENELRNLKKELGASHIEKIDSNIHEKIKMFLQNNNISSAAWIKSITKNEKLSKEEFLAAVEQDLADVEEEQVDLFWQKYSSGDYISSSTLISLFEGEEVERLSLDQIFTILKAKVTYNGIRNIKEFLESLFKDDEITEKVLIETCRAGVFVLESENNIKTLARHLLGGQSYVKKSLLIDRFLLKFQGWVPLTRTDLEGICRRFQSAIFSRYEEVMSRIQEKTHYQSVISLENLVAEFKELALIDSQSEETCLNAVIVFNSESVNRVLYLKVITCLYECNLDFIKDLKDDELVLGRFSVAESSLNELNSIKLRQNFDSDQLEESDLKEILNKNEFLLSKDEIGEYSQDLFEA